MKRHVLTTVDNPYSPVDEFKKWYIWDYQHGYMTAQRVAKVAKTNRYMTDAEAQRIINGVVDDFIRLDDAGIYKRIVIDE